MILALKSLLWPLSTGLAFAGAWWVKFAKDHPTKPDRVQITPAGRVALIVAVIALLLSVGLEVVVWRQNEAKERKQQESSARAETRAEDMHRTVKTILQAVVSLPVQQGSDAARALSELGQDPNLRDSLSEEPDLAELLAQTQRFMSGNILETDLQRDIDAGDVAAVRRKIAGGASVRAQGDLGQTPLHYAVQSGNREIAEMLLAAGSDPNALTAFNKRTPLHLAALLDRAELVDVLLRHRANPNISDDNGSTPLTDAVFMKRAPIVDRLLAAGANVNVETRSGDTPLKEATFWGDRSVVRKLLEAGADPNYVPKRDGVTALHRLARVGGVCLAEDRLEVMDDLVAKGARCETADKNGSTPLVYAVQYGCETLVARLVKCGANPAAKFPDGVLAAPRARELGFPRIAEILEGAR